MARKTKSEAASLPAVLAKYAAQKEVECVELSVDVLNTIWGGGMYLGYMYSMWSEAGAGKSTLALQVVKSFCKKGLKVLFVDVEKALNESMQKAFGVQQYVEDGTLIIVVADNYLQVEEIVCAAATGDFSLVVIDSESMIQPYTPVELKITDIRPGLRASQESLVLNKMKSLYYANNIASLVLFHARANIQIMGGGGGTQPAVKQAGGFTAEHTPDIITKIQKHGQIKEDDQQIGVEISLVTTKNKFCSPFQIHRKKLIFGVGISKKIDLVDTAVELGIITQSGAYFKLPDGSSVMGRKALYDLPSDTLRAIQARIKG